MTDPNERADADDPRHPIQVVSKRTGISADVLRAWEKRYAAIEPDRSETGRRLYSDEHVERLSLLRQLTEGGRRIGDVADLPLEKLVQLVAEDGLLEAVDESPSAAPPSVARPHTEEDRPHLVLLRDALRAGDSEKLAETLALAITELSTPVFLHEIGVPLLRDVGVRWRSGDSRIAPEEVLSLGLGLLFGGRSTFRLAGPGAPVALFVPWGAPRAEIDSLLAASVAGIAGWRSLSVSPELDPDEIVDLALETRASRIVVTVSGLATDGARAAELETLLARLPRESEVIAIGVEREDDAAFARRAGLAIVKDLGALVEALGSPAS